MIWTKQQEKNTHLAFADGVTIYLSTQYKSSSYFHVYPSGNNVVRIGFKRTNVALNVKKLQKVSKSEFVFAGLDDLIEVSHDNVFCEDVFREMIKANNINMLSIHTSLLTESITQIKSLEYLTIYGQSTETLPDYLANIPNLKWLDITNIRLDKIPECVFKMPNLIGLQLKVKSSMSQLPTLFDSLPNVEYLEIVNSAVTIIPENIANLKNLKILSLGDNKLRKLPSSFIELKKLEYFVFNADTKIAPEKIDFHLPEQFQNVEFGEKDSNCLETISSISKNAKYITTSFGLIDKSLMAFEKYTNLEKLIINNGYSNSNTIDGDTKGLFQALAQLPQLKDLTLNNIPNLEHIEFLQNIDNLTILYAKNGFENIGQLTKIKNIDISYCQVSELPSSWNQLQKLESLTLKDMITDFKNLGELTSLKNISTGENLYNIKQFLSKNLQLEVLKGYKLEGNIGDEILNLTNLTHLVLNPQHFGNRLPQGISQLTNLNTLYFRLEAPKVTNPEFIPEFFKELSEIDSLRSLYIWNTDFRLPFEVSSLKQLKHSGLFHNHIHNDFKPLLEIALLPQVELPKDYNPNQKEYIETFYALKNYELTDIQRIITYGIVCENLLELRHYLPNPLPDTLKKDSCFYIAGRPHGMTKPQTKEQLLAKGFGVSNSVNNETTHISIGLGLGIEEVSKLVTSGKILVLSENVTELSNSPDDFFLLQEENHELTTQIVQLFLSEEESNHQLALQMLSGGGATKRVINYLLVTEGMHPNLEIRKEARKLFKRFASGSAYDHVKNKRGWDYMKGELSWELFNHPELNYWDGVLAYQTYRNKVTWDRLTNDWTYSRDQPLTITINEKNIDTINEIPEELTMIRAEGITIGHYYENSKLSIEKLCEVARLHPSLKKDFYSQYGSITQTQYNQLKEYFNEVHINDYFKIVG